MARKLIGDIVLAENRELGFLPGDAAAHRAAAALADRFDAPTIISLTNAITYTQEMGGQFWGVTLRQRVNEQGELVPEDQPGEYQTVMLRFEYESRDARIAKASTPPSEVGGIEVSDFSEAPTKIQVPEGPEEPRVGDVDDTANPPTIVADGGTKLPCDGAAYEREDYPELATALKDAYGTEDEAFRVPDLRTSTLEALGEREPAAA
jgi:Phage Tail Collar Domain